MPSDQLRVPRAQVPVLFPQCRGLDLRRCRLKAGTVPLLARLTVPTTAVRVDIKVSKKKQRQVCGVRVGIEVRVGVRVSCAS